MAAKLPPLELPVFAQRVRSLSPVSLADSSVESLFGHYSELVRWSPRLALIGPGTVQSVLERHFGESLAALSLLEGAGPDELVDVGSGAGFPGLVLAAALPNWRVTLVEGRERKWAFLRAATMRARLSCRCLNARVAVPLPAGLPGAYGAVTFRALGLPPAVMSALAARLTSRGRFLVWAGAEDPPLPEGLRKSGQLALQGSAARRILVLERA